MKNYFKTFKINDYLYQLKDPMGVLVTIVIGSKLALVVDTAYGIGDLPAAIREITPLPLIVINSHGHMDHTCGNYQFSEIYINKLDLQLCYEHNSETQRSLNLITAKKLSLLDASFDEFSYIKAGAGNVKVLDFKDIDLGGRFIKIIPLEGHTTGSLGFFLEKERLLITSDAICPWVWLFLNESTTVHEYIEMLKRTLNLDFTSFLVGHGNGELLPKNRILSFLKIAEDIKLSEVVKVTFNNFETLPSYCYTKSKMYDQKECGIIFNPQKM